MKKILVVLPLILLAVSFLNSCSILYKNTKKHSPEQRVSYEEAGLAIDIFYNRPSKKGRIIFGELVPFGETWRTGANEPTTFSTNQDLIIQGKKLPLGSYTLWTIPGEKTWTIIFNEKMYRWGVKITSKASRNPKYDSLVVEVPVKELQEVVEMFTIRLVKENNVIMSLEWDQTQIEIPIGQ